ncbi:MAG: 50S ribosomal protein L9 [Planctomycetota bacterium]|jgi:large subunit ribosomal protein L9
MASRRIELLLNRTVEHLGLVGDVVKVRAGYARNFLLPFGIAEAPTPERIEALKEAREAAAAEMAAIRAARADTIEKLAEITLELVRSCNDQGALYGSVTQRDISDGLIELGYQVDVRAVRLNQPIRRLGDYLVLIQFERDLKQEITVKVLPDRELEDEEATESAEGEAAEGEAGEGEGKTAEAASAEEVPAEATTTGD